MPIGSLGLDEVSQALFGSVSRYLRIYTLVRNAYSDYEGLCLDEEAPRTHWCIVDSRGNEAYCDVVL